MKDYGLLEGIRDARDYIFGDGNLPFIPFQENGDWEKYLPIYEPQKENFETYCCTVWGTQNAVEILYKRLYGIEPNYSERFTALCSGLFGDGGTDPQIPCESIRKDGLVDNKWMPMTETKEEFFSMEGLTRLMMAKGKDWLTTHDFMHEWVWSGLRPLNYKELLAQALTTSPLGVSVSAWKRVGDEYVSDQGGVNNHWCVLYKIDKEGHPWVFDSYSHEKKKLAKDHNIRRAKRFFIVKKTKPALSRLAKIIEKIITLLKKKL
jgi:hypothetical protein